MLVNSNPVFHDRYLPIKLHCGEPPHLCSVAEFLDLEDHACPTCRTPIATISFLKDSEIKNKRNFLGHLLGNGDASAINETVRKINLFMYRFPFRNIRGLEFLKNSPLRYREEFAYAFPGKKTIEVIEKFVQCNRKQKNDVRIIEYGAGRALWSRFFYENGFKVLAVNCKRTNAFYFTDLNDFIKEVGQEPLYVDENECGLPENCFQEILFLCWPENPFSTGYSMYAGRVLEVFRARGGEIAIYIGKGEGEDTAGPAFFHEMKRFWDYVVLDSKAQAMTSFSHSRLPSDAMYLLHRKAGGIVDSSSKERAREFESHWSFGGFQEETPAQECPAASCLSTSVLSSVAYNKNSGEAHLQESGLSGEKCLIQKKIRAPFINVAAILAFIAIAIFKN